MRRIYTVPGIGPVLGKLPPWALVLAFLVMGAGVGASPVVGGVTGEANTVVEQAITVAAGEVRVLDNQGQLAPTRPSAVFVLNTEGTDFTAAVSLATGDQFAIDLALANASLDQAAMDLTFSSEVGGFTATAILVCPDAAGVLGPCGPGQLTEQITAVAPSGPNTFIVQLRPESSGLDLIGDPLFELRVIVKVVDTIAPGFYKTTMNLTQIEN